MRLGGKEKAQGAADDRMISVAEFVYLAYFAIMLGAKAVGLYEGQFLYNVCLVIGGLLFGIKVLITKHSILEYLIMGATMGLGLAVYASSGEKSLLIFFTMMLGMKAVSYDKVFKMGSVIWGVTFVAMYVLSVVGVLPEKAFILDRAGWPPILRHTLGYPHPNTLHVAYLILVIFVLFSCKELSKKYITAIAVVLLLGNCYVFMYSLSRNGFLITCIYVFFDLYFLWRKNISKLEKAIIYAIYPFSALFMIVTPLVIKGDVFEVVNRIFAGRIVFTWYYLTYQPLKLFGSRDIPVPQDNFIIDSSYVYLIFRLGLIAFILYCVAMVLLIWKLLKDDKRAELAVVLALTFGGINETYLFNQSYKNFIFLFLGYYLYKVVGEYAAGKQGLLTKEIIGFSFGNKEMKLPTGRKSVGRRAPINVLAFSAFLLILFGILTSVVFLAATPSPDDIYIPESEFLEGRGEEVYLTQAQVKELKKEGSIIRGYVDEKTPLYRIYRKGTAKVEYLRYVLSYGLWGGCIVSIGFLAIWLARRNVRFLLQNKEIGSDYKENVLIVHNYYRIPGGEDIVVANEKALLEANGHKVILYSRNNAEAGDHNFLQKIGLAFTSLFSLRTYREVCSIIEKEKIDVLHVHNTVALVSPAVYLAGINRGIPVVQTIHNFRLVCPNGVCYIRDHVCERCIEHGLKASLLYNCYRDSKLQTIVMALSMKLQRMLLTYREINYICLTEFNKEKLLSLKQIREESVYIKPNFTTMEAEVVPFEDRKPQIVYAGRLEKIKGVDLLLQAWMKLGDKAPKLVICGSGDLDSWCREYISNNEMNNIEMLGQISNADVKRLIGQSLAIIYPTQWYEGFPMAVAEAYTMGTPIIAADIGNVGNLVEDGVTGLKFKFNSVVSLSKAVEKFMDAPIELPQEYYTKYTADNNYVMLKKIYEDVRRKNLG